MYLISRIYIFTWDVFKREMVNSNKIKHSQVRLELVVLRNHFHTERDWTMRFDEAMMRFLEKISFYHFAIKKKVIFYKSHYKYNNKVFQFNNLLTS